MPTVNFNDAPHPVNTIYCIGRSYTEHIHELGNEAPTEPLVFLKPNSSIVTGNTIILPDFSDDIHHEIELALLIGNSQSIIGVAAGLDLTARDIQNTCKQKGLPWLKAKGFKHSCWLGNFKPFVDQAYRLTLTVNGDVRQDDSTDKMRYDVSYLVKHLDELYGLTAGDIIMTGTPKGVGRLTKGDELIVSFDDETHHLLIA
ncbi:fumarylacetoacetate hydrolase family protein [Moraxella sp. Tifton1]|uniref:Fumarylacetoacetate hydrolase family protein n=1 Tax=Moraxella oculi TaxID=2940516 RepID=A0ABW8U5I3_9GAMM|nr:fumarylacetoacetate hydrolase family protein [Moraxella sp. Tifton1]MCL1623394.1 fumarylacetoacetate hydrolase family protein [Moraxella sp. Tifton1]